IGATVHRPFSKRFACDSSGSSSPQGKFCFESLVVDNVAAFSHSASVGRRLPTHFAYAEASKKLTCDTGSFALSIARCSPAKSRIIHSPSWNSQYKGARQCSVFTFSQPAECHQRKSWQPPAFMNSRYSPTLTGARSIEKSSSQTLCAGFSLSQAKS